MTDRSQLDVLKRHARRLRALLCTVALVGAAAPAAAQVVCGGTVGPGGTFTMTSDILACTSDPALRVVGQVVLDMAGHRLSCDSNAAFVVGISIEGKDATVRNGSVEFCTFGIGLFGGGRHTVRDVTVHRGLVGIVVATDRNRLLRNGVRQATADGYSISGSDSVLDGNAAVGSPVGFLIQGLRNSFVGNVASENDVGFEGSGSADTTLSRNIAEGKDVGFRVIAGTGGHLLRDNLAIGTRNFDSSRGFLVAEADGTSSRQTARTITSSRASRCRRMRT